MNRWKLLVALLLGATALVCTSCTQQRICNGPEQQPPSLLLDAGTWAAAHPSAQLTSCLAGTCTPPASSKGLAEQTAEPIEIVLPQTSDPRSPVQLSITASEAGRDVVKISSMITLDETDEAGACGTVLQWKTSAELKSSGELVLK
ncbi:hypothetical protein ABIB25_005876 [Nakamurella sp. UYEF19]|uniref:hypothetical protein n=1 Tax=Nakamurella sp. UYEF19 TaxID=1756392 RepID=UPI003398E3E6